MPETAAIRGRGGRRVTANAAVIGAALAMAACSAHSPAAIVRPPHSPAVSATVGPSAATTLTGAQLDSALAPASSFPGFTANTKYAYQAGGGVEALPVQYNLATMSCTSFVTQLIFPTWFGQTGMAWAEYDLATDAQSSQQYDEFVYQFADTATASSFVQDLRSAFSRCQGFTSSNPQAGYSDTTTFAVTNVAPIGGGQAMQVTAAATATTGTVAVDFLFVITDNDVYGVVRVGGLTAVPASPAASAIIAELITHVETMSG